MIKSTLIFLVQALVVSILTVGLGSELYLYYKEKIERPVVIPECPYSQQYEREEWELACIDNLLFKIKDSSIMLYDDSGSPVICSEEGQFKLIRGYQLWRSL